VTELALQWVRAAPFEGYDGTPKMLLFPTLDKKETADDTPRHSLAWIDASPLIPSAFAASTEAKEGMKRTSQVRDPGQQPPLPN
jgi:hypothetical protein